MHTKIVLIGAGSAQFGFGTLSDIFASEVLAGSEIVLHDINAQALQQVYTVTQHYIEAHQLPFTLSATAERRKALQGADFCIISIEVGDRFELWEQDWMIPLQYGIRQVYGENGGPGGLFHSLRIIPPIIEICDDIMEICPEALVFNFSNPMTRICLTVKRKHPDLRLIGLCHEIAHMPQHLPKILGVPWDNIGIQAAGLNHFTVLLKAWYQDSGKDAYPDIRTKAPRYFEGLPSWTDVMQQLAEEQVGSVPGSDPALRAGAQAWAERKLIKAVFEIFGYLPVTTDSHFGEYIQWAHSVVDHKGILDFYHFYKEYCQVDEAKLGRPTEFERVVPIIEGTLTDSGHEELAVNIMNEGLITNLTADMAVEVPAMVDKDGVHGIVVGDMPRGIVGLLNNQVATNDLTAEAVLQQSKNLALQALLLDPVVHSVQAAEQTLETMLALQAPYLGYLK